MVADPEEEARVPHPHGVHESPWIMLFPLVVLAILSVIGGWVGIPIVFGGSDEVEHFLQPIFNEGVVGTVTNVTSHGLELGLAAVSVLVALTRLLHRLHLLLQEATHRRRSRRTCARALSSGRKQVLHRRDLWRLHRHAAAHVLAVSSSAASSTAASSTALVLRQARPPEASAHSYAAFNRATSVPTPAGSHLEQPPFCWS